MLLRLFQNGSGGRKVAGSSPVAPTGSVDLGIKVRVLELEFDRTTSGTSANNVAGFL